MKTIEQSTAMREAFLRMRFPLAEAKGSVISACVGALKRDVGIKRVREWDAHLKLHTYNALKMKGVM